MSFEENDGQAPPAFRFISRRGDHALLLSRTEAMLVVDARASRGGGGSRGSDGEQGKTAGGGRAVFRTRFVGAASSLGMAGVNRLPGKVSYFIGADPSKWKTGLPTYAGVRYEELYRGIDLVYHGSNGRLEYDFVVKPGADPRRIALEVDNGAGVSLDPSGDLILASGDARLRWLKPVVYQEGRGGRERVEGRFVLRGDNRVGFDIGIYDRSRPLVIDPLLMYSSYLGGATGPDIGFAIAAGADGSAYVAGRTYSLDFPLAHPYQSNPADIFVSRISPDGKSLVYSTYLGGSLDDSGFAVATDSNGNAYVAAYALSRDLALVNPLPFTVGYGYSAYLVKLDPTGTSLVYATLLGGAAAGYTYPLAIAADDLGNAYVTGWTNSTTFPTTPGAYRESNPGPSYNPQVAFVTKIAPEGSTMIFSTFLGGSDWGNAGLGIAVDPDHNVYVAGGTGASDFPTTPGALQRSFTDFLGVGNGFVTKLSPDGSALVYSTYLGGSRSDGAHAIAVDDDGYAYVTGSTESFDFPTKNAWQSQKVGDFLGVDAFVAKIDPSGASLDYSTYLGGAGDDSGNGIAVDRDGNALVAGDTTSADFPILVPIQPNQATTSARDAFLTKFSSDGSMAYSTCLGGSGHDLGYGVAVDLDGNAYVAGYTSSGDFRMYNAFQEQPISKYGANDAFVAKIGPVNPPGTPPVALCHDRTLDTEPGTCAATDSVNDRSFDRGGDPITLAQSPAPPFGLGTTPVTLTVTDDGGASATCDAEVTVVDAQAPAITCPETPTAECESPEGAHVSFQPTATDNCPAGLVSFVSSPPSESIFPPGTTNATATAIDSGGNRDSCEFKVSVIDTTPPTASASFFPRAKLSPNKGSFVVDFDCSDTCDPQAVPSAALNGYPLTRGQRVDLKVNSRTKPKMKKGVLAGMNAPSFDLEVSCLDSSGNVGSVTVHPLFPAQQVKNK